jgi:nucleoside-diphosphate-sugar epimerase
MSSPIKTVTVLGASGNIGRPIVTELLSQGTFTVTAVIRSTSTATFPENVRVIHSDYSLPSLTSAFQSQDAVISTIATLSIPTQLAAIDAMIAAGVKRFIPSEYGVDTSGPDILTKLPPAKGKTDTIAYLRTKESQISWTGMIVGAFQDWGMVVGVQGWNLRAGKITVWDSGDQEWEGTNIGQIAKATVACLQAGRYEATANQYVFVNSFTLTQNRVIAALEKVLGKKMEIERVASSEVAEKARRDLATGEIEKIGVGYYPKGAVGLIACQLYNMDGLNNYSKTKGLWNERLGLEEEDLEDTVRRVVAEIGLV